MREFSDGQLADPAHRTWRKHWRFGVCFADRMMPGLGGGEASDGERQEQSRGGEGGFG